MNLLTTNGVKVYNVSAGKSLPEWLSDRKKSELKNNKEFRERVELIQDFSFDTASQRIKVSPDGQYILATGTYPPQVKIFELDQLSNKVTRHMDSNILQFEILSQDYSKPVFLRDDRYIEFHSKSGSYFKVRTPKQGRDFIYHKESCDLYIAGDGNEVYRLNLEEGRFMKPLSTNLESMNVVAQNPLHQLLMFGSGDSGVIECWDPRQKTRVASLDCQPSLEAEYAEDVSVTAAKFAPDGLTLGIGFSTGAVQLYDIRSSAPVLTKYHQYQLPINSINFHNFGGVHRIMTSDAKSLKVFERDSGKVFMALEPPAPISDVLCIEGTGLLMMPCATQKIQSYYIPSLGPAPKWCSFLDNLTEELEEDKQLIYEDYKFISRDEVEQLNLEKMIGTGYLKAYMQGFFIHIKLYNKIKSIQNPFEYEEYRQQRVAEAMRASSSSRISATAKSTKDNNNNKKDLTNKEVNSKFAERLVARSINIEQQQADDEEQNAKVDKVNPIGILNDPRFGSLWTNKNFEHNEDDEDFKKFFPKNRNDKLDSKYAEHFENIEDDFDEDMEDDLDDNNNNNKNNIDNMDYELQDDEDDEEIEKVTKKSTNNSNTKANSNNNNSKNTKNKNTQDDEDEDGYDNYDDEMNNNKQQQQPKKKVNFYEMKTGHTVESLTHDKVSGNASLLRNAPLSVRLNSEQKPISIKNAIVKESDQIESVSSTGDKEISFIPTSKGKRNNNNRR